MRRHGVRQLLRGDDVIGEQHADLIARQGDILAGLVLEDDAGAVRIRVGADDEVNVVLLCQINGQIEAFLVLRVRVIDGREIAVDLHLLGLTDNVLVAEAAENFRNQTIACAVERGVNELEVVCDLLYAVRVDGNLDDLAEVRLVGVLAEHTDHAALDGLIEIRGLNAGEDVGRRHFLCDYVRLGRGQLCAVLPVDLVTVVFLRVMGCGDVDARDAAVVTDCKGQLRGRAQLVEDQRLDAVRGEDARGLLCELGREVTGVVCDRNAAVHRRLTVRYDQLRKALRRLTDGKAVHAVEADAQNAAQACRAERQRRIKTALDLFFIVCNRLQLCVLLCAQRAALQPVLVFSHEIHVYHLSRYLPRQTRFRHLPKPLSKLYDICLSMQGDFARIIKNSRSVSLFCTVFRHFFCAFIQGRSGSAVGLRSAFLLRYTADYATMILYSGGKGEKIDTVFCQKGI